MHNTVYAGLVLVAMLPPGGAPPTVVEKHGSGTKTADLQAFQGLWFGSWGGGQGAGVIFQPVLAELFVKGDHIECSGFRAPAKLTGTIHVDARLKEIHVTPTDPASGKPTAKTSVFRYVMEGDKLVLYDREKVAITLRRQVIAQHPLANVRVELAMATGINVAGDLLVTEFTEVRVGRAGAVYFQPQQRSLKIKQAHVLVVQESGCKEITIQEARGLLREAVAVAITYRPDSRPQQQLHELSKEVGPPTPDSEAVG